MNTRTALMFASAILLLVSVILDREGQVSKIAEMDGGDIRTSVAQSAASGSFAGDDEIGVQASELERDEGQQQRESLAARRDQPEIGQFSPEAAFAPLSSPSAAPSSLASIDGSDPQASRTVAQPGHHRLEPGEVRLDFDPAIAG